jgi:phospholipid/cholesterol/gamma-HCH transport system ATP-binding protein
MAWPAPDATRPIWKTRPPEATAIQVTDSNTVPGADPVGAGNVIVDVRDAHYSVGGREIFSGLSLQALKGQITAVMGPSGTGKTTLLRLITAQIYAQSGQVMLFGENLAELNRSQLFALRRRMGMLFQNSALLTDINVFENVAFPLREHTDLPESLIRNLVLTRLNAVGLRGAASLMPAELSGGMARRVALARAVVMDPELLIYDEPFVGLDPIARGVIMRLVQQLNEALGITSIIVSHDVRELAKIAHRSYLMAAGKIVAEGTPDELAASQSPIVRQFMSGDPDGPSPFHYPARDLANQLLSDPPIKARLPVPGARP